MKPYLLALIFVAGFAIPAFADCNCNANKSLAQHQEDASVIVLGTCVNIITNPIKGGYNVSFQVDSSWNRAIEPIATFHTNADNQCGFKFELDKQYVVFGKKKHQTTRTTKCEPNILYDAGGAELVAQFGKGFSPGRPGVAKKMNLMMLGLGAGAILFIAFVVLRKRIFPPKNTATS